MTCERRNEEDKPLLYFPFPDPCILVLVDNNSSLSFGMCPWTITGILSYVLLPVISHRDDIPDILDIPGTVSLYLYHYDTATHACMSCIASTSYGYTYSGDAHSPNVVP